jgi:hypothetical protein
MPDMDKFFIEEGLVRRVRALEHEIGCMMDNLAFYEVACKDACEGNNKKIRWDKGQIAREAIEHAKAVLGPLS